MRIDGEREAFILEDAEGYQKIYIISINSASTGKYFRQKFIFDNLKNIDLCTREISSTHSIFCSEIDSFDNFW